MTTPDIKFHDVEIPDVAKGEDSLTIHHLAWSDGSIAVPVQGHDAATAPANDASDKHAADKSHEHGAKSTVSCRVGPNNADTQEVHGKTYTACALVHLLEVAVEYITVTSTILA